MLSTLLILLFALGSLLLGLWQIRRVDRDLKQIESSYQSLRSLLNEQYPLS